MQPFYLYGRLIAVLEQGARAQGQIPWLELYYPRGFLPWVGLREPLRNHLQSVLPFLERRGRADNYLARLNSLANALQNTEEPTPDPASFNSWCTSCLSHDRSPKPELPLKSTPWDAPLYAQGYLVERQTLQPQRPALPKDKDLQQFCWDYHQGRHLTWNIAGNDPGSRQGYSWASETGGPSQPPIQLADPAEPRIAPARHCYIPGRYPA